MMVELLIIIVKQESLEPDNLYTKSSNPEKKYIGLHEMGKAAILGHLPGTLGWRSIPTALLLVCVGLIGIDGLEECPDMVEWECPTIAANLRLKPSA